MAGKYHSQKDVLLQNLIHLLIRKWLSQSYTYKQNTKEAVSRKSQSGTMSAFLNGTDTEGHFPLDLVIRKSVMFCTETVNEAKTKIPNTSSSEHLTTY